MRLRTATVATILTSITTVASTAPADPTGSAGTNDQAGGSAGSPTAQSPTTTGDTSSSALTAPEPTMVETPVEYGIDIRARSIFVPKAELQLFLNRAAGSVQDYGIGADFIRRRGNNELQIQFYLHDPFFAYRSIERAERAPRLLRYARFLSYSLSKRAGTFGSGPSLRLNDECRSYHLGWILFAWAERLAAESRFDSAGLWRQGV